MFIFVFHRAEVLLVRELHVAGQGVEKRTMARAYSSNSIAPKYVLFMFIVSQ